MTTPIVDFVREYAEREPARFHMPGHKGSRILGAEPYDITEIEGADALYHGDGIIAQSEKNAARLFGSGATHYSVEGSTLCIKAMLAILVMEGKERQKGKRPYILAARNVHKSMVDACALLDLDLGFVQAQGQTHLCSAVFSADTLAEALDQKREPPLAVYLTSPDYLGQMADLASLAAVCRAREIPLLVDNAHGAYLHFLKEPLHPLDLGAAMCCDSAHKTLTALTGTAYLHIHRDYVKRFEPYARQALLLFASTSPSYLLLQSLDACNRLLDGTFPSRLKETVEQTNQLKKDFLEKGIPLLSGEPLKIVLHTMARGYRGTEIAQELRSFGVECEYADLQYVVLMVSPYQNRQDWRRLKSWSEKTKLLQGKQAEKKAEALDRMDSAERVMTIREAVFAKSERVPAEHAVGRICAAQTVSCPPAVPIAISGERITEQMARIFLEYGILQVDVVA